MAATILIDSNPARHYRKRLTLLQEAPTIMTGKLPMKGSYYSEKHLQGMYYVATGIYMAISVVGNNNKGEKYNIVSNGETFD